MQGQGQGIKFEYAFLTMEQPDSFFALGEFSSWLTSSLQTKSLMRLSRPKLLKELILDLALPNAQIIALHDRVLGIDVGDMLL